MDSDDEDDHDVEEVMASSELIAMAKKLKAGYVSRVGAVLCLTFFIIFVHSRLSFIKTR